MIILYFYFLSEHFVTSFIGRKFNSNLSLCINFFILEIIFGWLRILVIFCLLFFLQYLFTVSMWWWFDEVVECGFWLKLLIKSNTRPNISDLFVYLYALCVIYEFEIVKIWAWFYFCYCSYVFYTYTFSSEFQIFPFARFCSVFFMQIFCNSFNFLSLFLHSSLCMISVTQSNIIFNINK